MLEAWGKSEPELYLFSTALAILVGFSTGVQALSAEATGRDDLTGVEAALKAGVLSCAVGAICIAALLVTLSKPLFRILTDDPVVAKEAARYFAIRMLGLPALAINGAFRGYWKGISKPTVYTRVLILTLGLNILFDWLLIFGKFGLPALGLIGAAVGFVFATTIGMLTYFAAWRVARPLVASGLLFSLPMLKHIVGRSLPAGLQQLIAVLSFPVLLYIMGRFGTTSLAAGTILINLSFALIILGQAFGFAASTLACEAYGASREAHGKSLTFHTALLGVFFTMFFALPIIIIPETIIAIFSSDPAVVAAAAEPARLVGLAIPIDAFGMVLLQTMLAVGQGRQVVLVSLCLQWLVTLPLSFLLEPVMGHGLIGVWAPQIVGRCVQAALLYWLWLGPRKPNGGGVS